MILSRNDIRGDDLIKIISGIIQFPTSKSRSENILLTNQTWKLEIFHHEIAYVVAFMIESITLFSKK